MNQSSLPSFEFTDPDDPGFPTRVIFSVTITALQACLSLPLGCLLAFLILTQKEFRKEHNLIILNLQIAEAVHLLSASSLDGYSRVTRNVTVCTVTGFFSYTGGLSALLLYPLLSINRYFALLKPEISDEVFTKRKIWLFVGGIWLYVALILSPFALTASVGFNEMQVCGVILGKELSWKRIYFAIAVALGLLFSSYSITLYCNLKIYAHLQQHKNHVAHVGLSSGVVKEFSSITRMIVVYSVLPLLLESPFICADLMPGIHAYPWVGHILITLYHFVPMASPYIVVICLKPYREAVLVVLHLKSKQPHGKVISVAPASQATQAR